MTAVMQRQRNIGGNYEGSREMEKYGKCLEEKTQGSLEDSSLDPRELINQGLSPQEAAQRASEALYEKLGIEDKVEIEKQVKKAPVKKGVSNLEVACVVGGNILNACWETFKFLYAAPTSSKNATSQEEFDAYVSFTLLNLGVHAAGIIGYSMHRDKPEKLLWLLVPIATHGLSALYEYFLETKKEMEKGRK